MCSSCVTRPGYSHSEDKKPIAFWLQCNANCRVSKRVLQSLFSWRGSEQVGRWHACLRIAIGAPLHVENYGTFRFGMIVRIANSLLKLIVNQYIVYCRLLRRFCFWFHSYRSVHLIYPGSCYHHFQIVTCISYLYDLSVDSMSTRSFCRVAHFVLRTRCLVSWDSTACSVLRISLHRTRRPNLLGYLDETAWVFSLG